MLATLFKTEVLIGICFAIVIYLTFFGKQLLKSLKTRNILKYFFIGLIWLLISIYLNKMGAEFWSLIGVIAVTIGNIIKSHWENHSTKEKVGVLNIDMANSFRGFETQLVKIDRKVDKINEEDKFRNKLRNSVRSKAAQIVELSGGLEPPFKHVMMGWCNEIIDFALIYNYSQFRGEEKRDEMYAYLQVDFSSKRAVMKNMTNDFIKGIKVFPKEKDRSQRGMLFSDLLEKTGIFNQFEILIMTLAQNGLENDDIIKIFTKFIQVFFKDYQKDVLIWKTLNVKEMVDV